MFRALPTAAFAACVSLFICPIGQAQTPYTWSNAAGDNLWATAGNWSPVGPPLAADLATFDNLGLVPGVSQGSGLVLINSSQTVSSLTFNNSVGVCNFTGSGGLTIGNGAAGTLTVGGTAGGGFAQIGVPLSLFSGSTGSVSAGSTLVLTNPANVLNGSTLTVGGTNGGTLRANSGTAGGTNSLANSTIALTASGRLFIDGPSSVAVVNGLWAREFVGANLTNAISSATAPAGLGGTGQVTSQFFSQATPSAALLYPTPGVFTSVYPTGTSVVANATNAVSATARFNALVAGLYTFRSNLDDNGRILIDGIPVSSDTQATGHGAQAVVGVPVYLAAGYHNIELQLSNNSGGGAFEYTVQAPNATTSTLIPSSQLVVAASGTSGLNGTTALNMTTTNVSVAAGQTGAVRLNINGVIPQANVGNLTLGVGSIFNLSATTADVFTVRVGTGDFGLTNPATTFANGTQTINVAVNNTLAVGRVLGGGASAVVTKTGAGTLLFDNSAFTTTGNVGRNDLAAGSTIDIQAGVVTGLGTSGAISTQTTQNPFGFNNPLLQLNGGTLRLDTRGGSVTFGNALTVTAVGGRLEAPANGVTMTLGGAVTLNGTLTAAPLAGSTGTATAVPGATLALSGGLSGTGAITVSSPMVNATGVNRQYNSNWGILSLSGASAGYSGAITVGDLNGAGGTLQASGANAASSSALGTATLQLNFGRLFLRNNGTASNTTVAFGNNVNVNGGFGFNFDVNNNGANTGNTITLGTLTVDTAGNAQKFSLLNVTGGSTYALGFTGAATINGNVQVDTASANLNLTGGLTNAGTGSLFKSGVNALTLGNFANTTGSGTTVVAGGTFIVSGAAASLNTGVIAYAGINGNVPVVVDGNTTVGTSAYGANTINLRNGAVYRIDTANKTALPTISTAVPVASQTMAVLALNASTNASYNFSATGINANNLYLGGSGTYTGGTITPFATTYFLGGSGSSGQTLVLIGNGTNPVLADVAGATSAVVGSRYFTALGGQASTVQFNNPTANPNTFTGSTFIATGFTANVTAGGAATPLGTGAVTVAGTLQFSGANGSAVNAGSTANNNSSFTFVPGSALFFGDSSGSGTVYSGTSTEGRWDDSTAINLYGTTLTIRGSSTTATATSETLGSLSFDGASAVVLNQNGTTGGNVGLAVNGNLTRTGQGTLRISTPAGATTAALNSTTLTLSVSGTLTGGATLGTSSGTVSAPILPAYVVTEGAAAPIPTFVAAVSGTPNAVVPLGTAAQAYNTASATALNTATSGVIDQTAALTLTQNPTIAALRLQGVLTATATSGNLVTIGTAGGGVIFSGTGFTSTAGFAFGTNEAIVYTQSGQTYTLTNTQTGGVLGGITGSGGLTKFGGGSLAIANAALSTTAAALTGTVTVNEGTLNLTVPTGASTTLPITNSNPLVMNGGTLQLRNDVSATYFTNLTLRGSAGYDILRAGGTTANATFTIAGTATFGEAGRADPIVFTGNVNSSTANFVFGAGGVTLNQDLILSGGRTWFNGTAFAGNNKTLQVVSGAVFLANVPTTGYGLSSAVFAQGTVFQPQTSSSTANGNEITFGSTTGAKAPVTFLGTQVFGGGTAGQFNLFTDPYQIYSNTTWAGATSMVYAPAAGGTVTLGVSEQPTPLTFGSNNSGSTANQVLVTRFENPNLNFTALTITGTSGGGSNGSTSVNAVRQLLFNGAAGTTNWKVSGPIDIGQAVLHFVVPGPATSGTIDPALTNLTTLRANAGSGNQADLWFTAAGTSVAPTTTARIAFTQTYLDSNLRIDPAAAIGGTSTTGLVVGANAHVSLGTVVVNGDRQLWIWDQVNRLTGGTTGTVDNSLHGTDFAGVIGGANSILRLTTNSTGLNGAMLFTDISATMLGMVVLNGNAGSANSLWTMTTTGALGALGLVTATGNATILNIPGTTTLTGKDNLWATSGAVLVGSGLGQLVVNGPASGPRVTIDPGVNFLVAPVASAAGAGTTSFSTANLPGGIATAGIAPVGTLTLNADVNTNLSTANTALTGLTLGGASGIGFLNSDGSAVRTVTSGIITAGGPFFIRGAGGQSFFLGGTVTTPAANNTLNIRAATGLPAGYLADVIVTAATANGYTLFLGNSAAGGTAGNYDGVRRFVVTGGASNVSVNLQPQQANALGGTGTTKAGAVLLFSANTTQNNMNPGANALTAAAVALQFGSVLQLDDSNNITASAGPFTFRTGSVLRFTGGSGVSAIANGTLPSITSEPGVILRIDNPTGTANVQQLTTVLGANSQSAVYRISGANYSSNATIAVNRDASVPFSGMVSTDAAARTLTFTGTAGLTIGANGGIVAALSGGTLNAAFTATNAITVNGPVQIGSPYAVDNSSAAQSGTVTLTGTHTFAAQTVSIVAGATLNTPFGSLSGSNAVSLDGTLTFTGTLANQSLGTTTLSGRGQLTAPAGFALTLDSIGRTNNGVLAIVAAANTLGSTAKVLVTNSAPANVGTTDIASPFIVNETDKKYVTYSAVNGLTNVTGVAYASATANNVATASASFATAGETKAALQITTGATAIAVSGTGVTLSAGGILFDGAGATAVTISAPITVNSATNELVVYNNSNQANVITGLITATGGFTKFGGNSLQVGNTGNIFGGNIYIQQGNLRPNVANGLGTTSAVFIGGAGVLDMFNFSQSVLGVTGSGTIGNTNGTAGTTTLTFTGTGSYQFDGIFAVTTSTSSHTLTHSGSGTQTFTNNIQSVLGVVNNSAGTLNFNGNLTTGGLTTNSGGTLNLNGNAWLNGLTVTGGTVNVAGRNLVFGNTTALTVSAGAVQLSGANTEQVYVSGNVAVSGTGSLVMNAATSHYIVGTTAFSQTTAGSNVVVDGAYNLFQGSASFTNNGTVTLNGTNTFNGATVAFANTGSVTINGTTVFNQTPTFGAAAALVLNGTTVFNAPANFDPTLATVGASSNTTFGNAATLTGGTFNLAATPTGAYQLPGSTGLVTIGGTNGVNATLVAATAGQTVARPLATGTGTGSYSIGSSATSGTTTYSGPVTLNSPVQLASAAGGAVLFSGLVSGSDATYGVTVTGGGIVSLAGANTFGGGVAVTTGTLIASNATGSATGSGPVAVLAGATLAGTGAISGTSSVAGVIRGDTGTGTGVLATGPVQLQSGGALLANLGTTGVNSRLGVTGTFDFAPSAILPKLTLVGVSGFDASQSGTWTLTTTTTGVTVGGFAPIVSPLGTYQRDTGTFAGSVVSFDVSGLGALPNSDSQFTLSQSGTNLTLSYVPSAAAVPESTVVGFFAALGLGLATRIRRRKLMRATSLPITT